MAKSVFITGASSGIGRAVVLHFQRKGWNVTATMRSPDRETELTRLENVLVLPLDVTRVETIAPAITRAIETFGRVDVLVNNAGYGLVGPFEAQSPESIRRQFDTNVFGLLDVTRAILPHFRANGLGVLVNIASMGGRLTTPLYSTYHATKWAVDGFSESLQFELRPLNIKVKIVEPGTVRTEFAGRSSEVASAPGLVVYGDFASIAIANMKAAVAAGASPETVARTIFRAATDRSWRLRYPVGRDATTLLFLRRFITDGMYQALVRRILLRRPSG